jgi:stage II sporulation protein P
LKKRTNNHNDFFDYLVLFIIPIILTAFVISIGTEKSLENIFYAGYVYMNPQSMFNNSKDNVSSDGIDKMALSEDVVGSKAQNSVLSVPDDVLRLMKNAEKAYAESSNDGEIIEKDCMTHNATSEYNGIYVRNTTLEHEVDIPKYLNGKVYADIDNDEPSVLVYHTHTTETYELLDRGFYTNERSTRSENSEENMVRIGEEICKMLELNGYKTIHDKTIYDKEYNGAYDRSFENVKKILMENPSIQIVLDVHRDAIYQKDGSKIKTVTAINGKKAAQITIVSGCEDGNVTDFPNWEKNLALAVQLQNKMKNDNPTLMRPLLFCSRRYNMHLTSCSLVVEIGTDANTLDEAVYSAKLFGLSLSEFLEDYK